MRRAFSSSIVLFVMLAHCQRYIAITPAAARTNALLETIQLEGEIGPQGITGDTGPSGPANTAPPVFGMRLDCADQAVALANGSVGCAANGSNLQDFVVQGHASGGGTVPDPAPASPATLVVTADVSADAVRIEAPAGATALDVRGAADFSQAKSIKLPLRWVVATPNGSFNSAGCNAKEIVVGGGCQVAGTKLMQTSCPAKDSVNCWTAGTTPLYWFCKSGTDGSVNAYAHCLQVTP